MDKNLRDFCIKNNLPFTVEFDKPWYPKPIEVSLSKCKNEKDLFLTMQKASEQAPIDSVIYGMCRFHIISND